MCCGSGSGSLCLAKGHLGVTTDKYIEGWPIQSCLDQSYRVAGQDALADD